MQDVSMRRMLATLVIAAAVALLVVSGALLFGMGKPAQAQSDPEPPCTTLFCLDKTATPNPATVGEPITFTITERCPGGGPAGCTDIQTLVDQVPPELTVDSVAPAGTCSATGNTVTCGTRVSLPTQPFTLTIVATPTECGTFRNTASHGGGFPSTATVTFTVVGCPPPTKEECKNGGWEEFGFPNQGTCVSAWNRQNRQETEV
jgi:Domain of unknown function DUF11